MNRRVADSLAGLVVTAVLVIGLVTSWQAYQRAQTFSGMMGGMMGGSAGGMGGTNFLWYVVLTVVAAVLVGGVYVAIRDDITEGSGRASSPTDGSATPSTPSETSPSESPSAIDDRPGPRRVLDLLPDDERRVLEPVLASPGLTQIELRDRSDFSKSKVSQTVSALEKRGLLYRERQGRTFRVYPDESVLDRASE